MTKAVSVVAKILPLVLASTAFLTPSPICRSIVPGRHRSLPLSPLFLFRRNNNKEQENVGVTDNPAEENKAEKEKSSFFNFFNRDQVEKQQQQHDGDDSTEKQQPAYTTAIADESPKTAMEEATWFRSEAEKARLEAERMDAELTLRKIERLEKELAAAAAFSNGTSDTKKRSGKSAADLQRQMDALLTKVRVGNNEKQSRSTFSSDNTATTTIATSNTPMTTLDTQSPTAATQVASPPSRTLLWPQHIAPYDENEYQELLDTVKAMPTFMQGSMAMQVELELDTDQETGQTSVNVTELAIRMDKMRRCDFSYSSKPPPTFTPLQISKLEAELVSADSATSETGKKYAGNWWGGGSFLFDTDNASMVSKLAKRIKTDERLNGLWEKDLNALAKLVLEYEYYLTLEDNPDEKEMDQIVKLMSQDNWLKPLLGLENGTFPSAVDEVIDSLYPKCTTKKNSEETNIPTEAQVMQFYTDILSKANFKATSKPEPVRGGYIVRGSTTLDGDMLISKLDAAMERSNLKDKMTILYTNDISMFADESMLDSPGFDPENIPPILYIVSPNICRDAMPVQLSIVTGLGIATSWYLSIIPFMLNPAIAARVDEQMAIAEANMIPDLAWLTDLSVPLFGTFLGIQLIHELGHLVVAGRNGVRYHQLNSKAFFVSIDLSFQIRFN